MAATADLGTGCEIAVARTLPKETAGVVGEAQGVEDLKQTIAAESIFKAAGSFGEGHKKQSPPRPQTLSASPPTPPCHGSSRRVI
ncbi:hypothetical protein B296_00016349 [Ensete ventricosum]|uniref:Uncharacterized protein n=1 Tax=Ensete ventricosum TaxID=4639 RepID=A0A426Z8R6_ENSVE|nr:hypothetical protein B296_00016349 [Ensete ventricosum]